MFCHAYDVLRSIFAVIEAQLIGTNLLLCLSSQMTNG